MKKQPWTVPVAVLLALALFAAAVPARAADLTNQQTASLLDSLRAAIAALQSLFASRPPAAAAASSPIIITSPAQGDAWELGSTHTIQWTGGDPSWPIYISLIDVAGNATVSTLFELPSNSGSQSWTVPANVATPKTYKVYVQGCRTCDSSAGSSWRYSGSFNIVDPNSTSTPPSIAGPDATSPTAPPNVKVTGVSTTQVKVTWAPASDNVGIGAYRIYRGQDLAATLDSTVYSYTESGLSPDTSYTYSVVAVDTSGNVSQSVPVTGKTMAPPDMTPPSAPTNVQASALSSSQISVNWTAATDNVDVTTYKVYRGSTLITAVNTTHYTDGGLSPSTGYVYTVVAYDAAGNASAPSAQAVATTNAAAVATSTAPTSTTYVQPPGTPTDLAATVNGTTVTLNWAYTSSLPVVNYAVYWLNQASVANNFIVSSTTYTISGLANGRQFFQVYARNVNGSGYYAASPASNSVTVTIGPVATSTPPTGGGNTGGTGTTTSVVTTTIGTTTITRVVTTTLPLTVPAPVVTTTTPNTPSTPTAPPATSTNHESPNPDASALVTAFSSNLYYGMTGNTKVSELQEFLTDQGLYAGPVSGNFFSLTLAGVKKFQARENITPMSGYFGPLTRARANAILAAEAQ